MNKYRYLANILTLLRISLIFPFLFSLLLAPALQWTVWKSRALATFIFFFSAITDFFDGYFARKSKQISSFGKFMDPLADKLLIISALISLLIIEPNLFRSEFLFLIGLREIGITILRIRYQKENREFKTLHYGKIKTCMQILSLLFLLSLITLKEYQNTFHSIPPLLTFSQFVEQHWSSFPWILFIPNILMFCITLLSWISAFVYIFPPKLCHSQKNHML